MPTKVTKKQLRAALLKAVEHFDQTSRGLKGLPARHPRQTFHHAFYLCLFLDDRLHGLDPRGLVSDKLWDWLNGGTPSLMVESALRNLGYSWTNQENAALRSWMAALLLAQLDAGDLDPLLS